MDCGQQGCIVSGVGLQHIWGTRGDLRWTHNTPLPPHGRSEVPPHGMTAVRGIAVCIDCLVVYLRLPCLFELRVILLMKCPPFPEKPF